MKTGTEGCGTCGRPLRNGLCPVCEVTGVEKTQASLEVLDGKYVLERVLGRGGMGEVWVAHELQLDRQVAVKLLAMNLSSDAALVARFEQEARMMARLDHPNLVPVYAVGRRGQSPYIVMKLLEGESLSELLSRQRRLAPADLLLIVRQLCQGLQFMHDRGVTHRDLKPANVFLSPEGHVTVLDLGVAREAKSTMTAAGMIVGTPRYMAPEQILGRAIDHRIDLYALALLTFELATGTHPFGEHDSDFELFRAHVEQPPPDASTLVSLPAQLGAVLVRGLAKDPAERFQSATEFQRALERAFEPRPARVLAPRPQPAPPPEPVVPRRSPWPFAIVGGVLLLGAVALALTFGRAGPTPPEPAVVVTPARPSTPEPAQAPPAPVAPARPEEAAASPEPAVPPEARSATPAGSDTPAPPPAGSARAPGAATAAGPRAVHGAPSRTGKDPAASEPTSQPEAPAPTASASEEWVAPPVVSAPAAPAGEALPKNRPRRIAFEGKLLSEEQTASYYRAREAGLAHDAAGRAALIATPPPVQTPPSGGAAAGPVAAGAPAPAGHKRVAFEGHVLDEPQLARYTEARGRGLSHEAAAKLALSAPVAPVPVAQVSAPAPTPAPVPAVPAAPQARPANLPKRIAVDGKLLSPEETEAIYKQRYPAP